MCICIKGIDFVYVSVIFLYVSAIFLLDFETVPSCVVFLAVANAVILDYLYDRLQEW